MLDDRGKPIKWMLEGATSNIRGLPQPTRWHCRKCLLQQSFYTIFGILTIPNTPFSMSLGQRIKERRKELGLTQADISRHLGLKHNSTVNGLEKGKTETSKHTRAIAELLKVTQKWLETGVEPMTEQSIESNVSEVGQYRLWSQNDPLPDDEYVQVPFYKDVEFQGGDGKDPASDYNGFTLAFAKSTLYGQGVQPNKAICITLSGDSMEPVMPNGTTCGVNTDDKTIVDGKYYAINHGGLLRIKRLYRLPNSQVKINSINSDEYPDETADIADIEVVGRIFHVSVLL